MKHRQLFTLLITLALLVSILAGCGGSKSASDAVMMNAMQAAPAEAAGAMEMEMSMDRGAQLTSANGEEGSAPLPESRKWIITVHMDAETEDLDAMTKALFEKVSDLEGFVEDQNIYNGSTYSARRFRNANLTIRVPAQDVDSFTAEVSGIANVVSNEKNLEDVTLRYTTTQNRVTALETEEARLLELMAQAETMSDLLEIEGRLTDVRTELENYGSQLRLLDNQIDYATIYLSISEVQEYTPVEEPTTWERIRDGFRRSLSGVGEGFVDFMVWILACSPYLVVYGLLLTAVVLLVRKHRARRGKKPGKKNDKQDVQNP